MFTDRKLLVSLTLVFALIVAGCGTRAPVEQQQAAEAETGSDLGGDLGGGLPAGASVNDKGQVVNSKGEVIGTAEEFGIESGGGSGGAASGGGSTDGGGGGSLSAGGSGGSGSASAGAMGPGISKDTIKIGVSYADDQEEANRALGAAGASQIDFRRAYEAMIKYVNEHGGAANRKLDPVYHRLSVTSTEPPEQQDQELCARWSKDDPVFIGDGGFKTENGIACFQKNGIVTAAGNGLRFKSGQFFRDYQTYMEFDGVDGDAIAKMYADNMKKMGFFDKGYKLGIVAWDDVEYARPTKNTLIPRLQQHGVKVTDVAYIRTPESSADNGEAVAQIGNTAVRFKGEGITHVMFTDSGGALALFFTQAAERQQYRPRYGITSASGGTAVADLVGAGNKEDARQQFDDALLVGWYPTLDVRPDDTPKWANPPSKKLCYEQMRKGGVEMDSANARALAEGVCNQVWTMVATLDAAHKLGGGVVNQQTWYQGLARVGSLPLTHGMGFKVSPTNRDALEVYLQAKFYKECTCFRYVSDRFQIPE